MLAVCLHTHCSLLDECLRAVPRRTPRTQTKDLPQRDLPQEAILQKTVPQRGVLRREWREVPHSPLMVLLRAFRTVNVLSAAESSLESLHQGNK